MMDPGHLKENWSEREIARGGFLVINALLSQVQTLGEFTLAKRRRLAPPLSSQASQCSSPPPRLQDKVTTTTDQPSLSFSLSVDIPDLEACLWPLRNLTSGTQTSPRAAPLRSLSIDSEPDQLLEPVHLQPARPLLGEQGRQYSTETQTEFDLFLDSIGVLGGGLEQETQTGQGEEEELLLFAHNCTQTELERLFSPPAPSLSSETQTSLTGFQEERGAMVHSVLTQDQDMFTHIETQTCDLQDLLT